MEFIVLHPKRIPAFLQIPSRYLPKKKSVNSVLASGTTRWQDRRSMATPNYAFEKRRRELDKKAKKEEKRKQKLEAASAHTTEQGGDTLDSAADEAATTEAPPALG